MDPAEISEYEAFLTDENLVYYTSVYMGSDDWQNNSDRPLHDLFADVRARFDLFRAENWPPSGPSDDVSPLQTLSSTLEPINQNVPTAQPPTYLNPGVSQDEIVIQQRGRRRLPVTWSPDIDFKSILFKSTECTPPKVVPTPQKVSTTRKRLTFLERNPMSPDKMDFSDVRTPEKFKLTSPVKETPPIKRPRIERTLEADFKGPIDVAPNATH
ncbi:hypothetical protein MSG28_004560 [Choristoneura fumiferana]|uniref:Uncharacterized protein n=1 Tax=Choristoneura fumiferana TaxID=7141 RepID=A0ACC0K6C1_CHOFU|nr:hypothetical protein MSG28_004560 [Choristoneura fumiferana]